MQKLIILFSLVLTTISCTKENNKNYDSDNEVEILKYIETHNLNAQKSPSGLYYTIEKQGEGIEVDRTQEVIVSYNAIYANGKPFAESSKYGQIFDLKNIISGLSEGISLFNEGGEGKLLIPSRLAYGNQDFGSIPAGSVIIFDIKVISTEEGINEINDSQITQYLKDNNLTDVAIKSTSGLYSIFDKKEDGKIPNINSTVKVKYKGYFLNGDVFDKTEDEPVEFNLQNVIPGFQEGLLLFKEGNTGTIILPSNLAYGFYGSSNIPPGVVIIFDVELIKVD